MNHYEVLGVAPGATDDEIKRAWARKVREHPPDKDARTNQHINEAKRVLLDPKARARYDAHLQHGEEIGRLILEALMAGAAEDHGAAAAAFRKAVALAPDDDETRNMWALATKRAGDVPGSVRILRGLVQRAPDVGLYRYNLGTMLWELEEEDDGARLNESLTHLSEAVRLEPHNADYHIGLARCFLRLRQFDQAEQAIEDALMTDGEVNVQDLDALFELPMIHILADRLHLIEKDAERIRSVVADLDEDAHEYCGYRFAQLAAQLVEAKGFKPAYSCAQAAVRCAPDDPDLTLLRSECLKLTRIEEELQALSDDDAIPHPIRIAIATRGMVQIDAMTAEDVQEHYNKAVEALSGLSAATILHALDYAKTKYPTLYELGHESFDHWRGVVSRLQIADRPQTIPQPANSVPQAASGGCVLPAAILALAFVTVVALLA